MGASDLHHGQWWYRRRRTHGTQPSLMPSGYSGLHYCDDLVDGMTPDPPPPQREPQYPPYATSDYGAGHYGPPEAPHGGSYAPHGSQARSMHHHPDLGRQSLPDPQQQYYDTGRDLDQPPYPQYPPSYQAPVMPPGPPQATPYPHLHHHQPSQQHQHQHQHQHFSPYPYQPQQPMQGPPHPPVDPMSARINALLNRPLPRVAPQDQWAASPKQPPREPGSTSASERSSRTQSRSRSQPPAPARGAGMSCSVKVEETGLRWHLQPLTPGTTSGVCTLCTYPL